MTKDPWTGNELTHTGVGVPPDPTPEQSSSDLAFALDALDALVWSSERGMPPTTHELEIVREALARLSAAEEKKV